MILDESQILSYKKYLFGHSFQTENKNKNGQIVNCTLYT